MSHQIKQVGKVALTDLHLLSQACACVRVPELKTALKLDMKQKKARYYNGALDACDGVITFGRPLDQQEKNSWYEIALRREQVKNAQDESVEGYGLYCDTHGTDRTITDRVSRIFQAYRVEELKQVGQSVGMVTVEEVVGRPGWTAVHTDIP